MYINPDLFSKGLSAILALLFGTVGAALCSYGVDKTREIGGWIAWCAIVATPFFIGAASFFLFQGVLGWSLIR